MFHSVSVQCPGAGSLPKTVSDYFSPTEPRNVTHPGHQSQMIMECPLCVLHMPAGFSKALGEHRAGMHPLDWDVLSGISKLELPFCALFLTCSTCVPEDSPNGPLLL